MASAALVGVLRHACRHACESEEDEEAAQRAVHQVLSDALRDQRVDVVASVCDMPEAAQCVDPRALSLVVMRYVYGEPRSDRTAALLRALFSAPAMGRKLHTFAASMLYHAASVGWQQGLDACRTCAAVTAQEVTNALYAAVVRDQAQTVRHMCSPQMLAWGVQPRSSMPPLLDVAAQCGSTGVLAVLGDVVNQWPRRDVQEALRTAVLCEQPGAVRALCAPPFVAQIVGEPPCACQLTEAVSHADCRNIEVLQALLAALPTAPAHASTVSRALAHAVHVVVGRDQTTALRACFPFVLDCVRPADLVPVDVVTTSVAHVITTDCAGTPRACTCTALNCLRMWPQAGGTPREVLTVWIADLKRSCHGCRRYYCHTHEAVLRQLSGTLRWRSRWTLLSLRLLRDSRRATIVSGGDANMPKWLRGW